MLTLLILWKHYLKKQQQHNKNMYLSKHIKTLKLEVIINFKEGKPLNMQKPFFFFFFWHYQHLEFFVSCFTWLLILFFITSTECLSLHNATILKDCRRKFQSKEKSCTLGIKNANIENFLLIISFIKQNQKTTNKTLYMFDINLMGIVCLNKMLTRFLKFSLEALHFNIKYRFYCYLPYAASF